MHIQKSQCGNRSYFFSSDSLSQSFHHFINERSILIVLKKNCNAQIPFCVRVQHYSVGISVYRIPAYQSQTRFSAYEKCDEVPGYLKLINDRKTTLPVEGEYSSFSLDVNSSLQDESDCNSPCDGRNNRSSAKQKPPGPTSNLGFQFRLLTVCLSSQTNFPNFPSQSSK